MVEFGREDRAGVVATMDAMAAGERGGGWVNLSPAVDPDDVPPSPTFRIFSVRGRIVPLCTWAPPERGRRAPSAASIGVQHGTGTRVVPLLAEVGVAVPDGWRVMQDQPKRGLVIAVPDSVVHDDVLVWLLQAGDALCPLRYDRWRAAVHWLH